MSPWRVVLEAATIAVIASLIAGAFNALRPAGLPMIARTAYETLVPCPEPGGPVVALEPGATEIDAASSYIVDARARIEYEESRIEGAVNVPYDWLEPVPDDVLADLARSIAASRAVRVIVYGDGGRPDSGEYLGREISGRGIKNVFFVVGGAPAVVASEVE